MANVFFFFVSMMKIRMSAYAAGPLLQRLEIQFPWFYLMMMLLFPWFWNIICYFASTIYPIIVGVITDFKGATLDTYMRLQYLFCNIVQFCILITSKKLK